MDVRKFVYELLFNIREGKHSVEYPGNVNMKLELFVFTLRWMLSKDNVLLISRQLISQIVGLHIKMNVSKGPWAVDFPTTYFTQKDSVINSLSYAELMNE